MDITTYVLALAIQAACVTNVQVEPDTNKVFLQLINGERPVCQMVHTELSQMLQVAEQPNKGSAERGRVAKIIL